MKHVIIMLLFILHFVVHCNVIILKLITMNNEITWFSYFKIFHNVTQNVINYFLILEFMKLKTCAL
jgi:hypothetical protein